MQLVELLKLYKNRFEIPSIGEALEHDLRL